MPFFFNTNALFDHSVCNFFEAIRSLYFISFPYGLLRTHYFGINHYFGLGNRWLIQKQYLEVGFGHFCQYG